MRRGRDDRHARRGELGPRAVLVVRGEPGIGKTELLRHLIAEAAGFGVARVAGVESEKHLFDHLNADQGVQQKPALQPTPLTPGERPPFDPDAT